MSPPLPSHLARLAVVYGGSGFVGRNVVRALAKRGWRVRVAVRRPELANHLQPMGVTGQIVAVRADLRAPRSVAAAAEGADAVVNLVGILNETGRQGFEGVQARGAALVAEAAARAGAPLVHVSAIGADADSRSAYARTKAAGEAAARAAVPGAVVLRPSIVFGPEDQFFNRFAGLARALPVIPLAGADTRFQPVFVGDVAEAVARALEGAARAGATYELGGPEVRSFRDLVAFVLRQTNRARPIVALPFGAARLQARALEIADTLVLGLLPAALKLTRDQVELLRADNVVSAGAEAAGLTLAGLGITPTLIEAVVPSYLWRYRKAGQFEELRKPVNVAEEAERP